MFSMWILLIIEVTMLSICAIDDLYYCKVNVIPIVFFTIWGAVFARKVSIYGVLPGIFLIAVSMICKNIAIGIGDGIVIMCLGLLIGLNGIWFTTFLALAMSCVYGIASLLFNGKNLKTAYPFIPFVFLGFFIFMYKKAYRDGSLTIEMSLLMPGIFAVIIFIVFTCYYLHDKCLFKRAAYKVCSNVSDYDDCDLTIEAENYFDEIIEGRTLGKWEINRYAKLEDEKVLFIVSGKMKFVGLFSDYLSNLLYTTNQTTYAYRINEAAYIYEHRN